MAVKINKAETPDLNLVPNRTVVACFEEAAVRSGGQLPLEAFVVSAEQDENMFGDLTGGYIIRADTMTSPVKTDSNGIECVVVKGEREDFRYGEDGSIASRESRHWSGWIPASMLVVSYRQMSDEKKLELLSVGESAGLFSMEAFRKELAERSKEKPVPVSKLERTYREIHSLYKYAVDLKEPVAGNYAKEFAGTVNWSRIIDLDVPERPDVRGVGFMDFKDCTNARILMKNGDSSLLHDASAALLHAVKMAGRREVSRRIQAANSKFGMKF